MGRSFLRAILNSARGIHPADQTVLQAQTARRIRGFAELDGIEFLSSASMGKGSERSRTRMSSSRDPA
jgi:hypothetical protein